MLNSFSRRLLRSLRMVALATFSVAMAGTVAHAEDDDRALLEVVPMNGAAQDFSRRDLEEMRQVTFTTTTPWTEGAAIYSGPTLLDILAASGIEEGRLRIEAINDYIIEMPVEDVSQEWPVVVTRIDGDPFPVKDKGPLWILYPFDDIPELFNEERFLTSVWQLARIEQIPNEGD